jgi:hypothetical protein
MDMVTVVVVLVVLAVIAAVALLAARSRRRKQEQQRVEAAEHRHEAEIHAASAQRREAEAKERAARAEREQAQAREQAARAQQDREAAQERYAAAERLDPDRSHSDETADPAGRTDDLRIPGAGAGGDHDRPAQHGAPIAHHADPAGHGEQHSGIARHHDGPAGQHAGSGGHHAGTPGPHGAPAGRHPEHEQTPDRQGPDADPAARTDDLRLGRESAGGHEAPGSGQQPAADDPPGRGWHGPTATGGLAAVDRGEQRGSADEANAGSDRGAPEVPTQRTGEHERHGVRALADRLLRRNG